MSQGILRMVTITGEERGLKKIMKKGVMGGHLPSQGGGEVGFNRFDGQSDLISGTPNLSDLVHPKACQFGNVHHSTGGFPSLSLKIEDLLPKVLTPFTWYPITLLLITTLPTVHP